MSTSSSHPHDPLAAARSGSQPPEPLPEDLAQRLPDLEVLGFLGRGGMGRVYRVRWKSDGAPFALKLVQAGAGKETAFRERFAREAEALTRLRHPNIASIHDHGEAGSWCWLLMDLVDGANLREVIATGRLSPAQTLALVPPLCAALQYAHDQGVVHRDLKPENILLDAAGVPRIVDFGLAKLRDPAGTDTLTQTGAVMGTLHYMAPEQVANAKGIDHRADIYGLGVVLYELLTGQLPLGRFEPPSQRVQVDVRIDEVVLKALERDPERRWQQARQIGEAMAGVEGKGLFPRSDQMAPPRSLQARWSMVILGVVAIASLVTLSTPNGGPFSALVLVASCIGMLGIWLAHLSARARGWAIGGIILAGLAFVVVGVTFPLVMNARAVTALQSEQQVIARKPESDHLHEILRRELADPAYAGVSTLGPDPVVFAPEIPLGQRVEVLLRLNQPVAMAVGNNPTADVLARICRAAGMTCLIPADAVFRKEELTFHYPEGPVAGALRLVAAEAGLRLTYGPMADVITASNLPEPGGQAAGGRP